MRTIRIASSSKYFRIFLFLGSLVTVLIIVYAFFITTKVSGNAVKEINKWTQSQLNQAVYNSEFTLHRIRQEALNMYANTPIQSWLYQRADSTDTTTLYIAADQIRNALLTNPFIHAIYMINFDKSQVYTSDKGLYDLKSFYDPAMIDLLRNNRPQFMKYFNHVVEGASYLTIVAETTPNEALANGYLVILLDKPLLGNYMLQNRNDYGSAMVMMDSHNEMILGNMESDILQRLTSYNVKDSDDPNFVHVGKREWVVQSAPLPAEGFQLYNVTPLTVWNQSVAQIRWTIIGSTVFLLIAVLLMVYWNSRQTYKPFADLAKRSLELVKGRGAKEDIPQQVHNDARLLEWGLQSLSEKVDDLNRFVKNNQLVVKEDYLRQWLQSNHVNAQVRRYLAVESPIFEYPSVRIAVIRIGAYGAFSKNYDFSSRKLLKFAIGNIAQEVLLENNLYGESVDMGSDHTVVIIGSEDEFANQDEELKQALERVRIEILNYLNISVTVALSRSYAITFAMQPVYQTVYELTLLSFLHAENQIYEENDGEILRQGDHSFLGNLQTEAIIQAIKMKDKKAMKAALEQYMEPLNRLSVTECLVVMAQLVYAVLKAFPKGEVSRELKSLPNLPDLFQTIGAVREALENQFNAIIEELGEKQSGSRKGEMAAEMQEYIQNHFYNPLLTVEEIAEHASVSVGYMYQIFKEQLQCTVADYIQEQRTAHVRKLLLTTDWPVQDIAEQSGFQTKSHFFTTFKKATGMTPNQYRQEKRAQGSEPLI